MGKLRKEPREKPFLSDKEYQEYRGILKEARDAASENHVYWDMDRNENANRVRKAFLYIAEKESISVKIRRVRGSQSLVFSFKEGEKTTPTRMSAVESRKRIVSALAASGKPLQKSEIINVTGISSSTWNIRIKELMGEGKVIRQGDRRDTKYSLAS